jgi:(4-(4-[2-(gamma-L-glutamylamino)ethyl]phenoxymethyl)furan-2-yl)methanamine synthase
VDAVTQMARIVGWDIGAANIKAALLSPDENQASHTQVVVQPFEIWRDKDRLPEMLRSVWESFKSTAIPQAMAVTMTAELSDAFAAKREGVLFIFQCLKTSFPTTACYVFSLNGEFIPLNDACTRPQDFAASNWLASAVWIARKNPNCLLLDVGSTTTDILPILDGEVRVTGRSDLERLSSGELVYTGALRTNLAAIAQTVPVAGRICRVASEYFAISGDVHLILGNLSTREYTCPTPDGQPASVDWSRRRLARLVCADTETLAAEEIDGMARYLHGQQVLQIRAGIEQVISRLPCLRSQPVMVLGTGSFLGTAAAKSAGMNVGTIAGDLERAELAAAPCVAVAHLLSEKLEAEL